jgi:cysteine desulfurase
MGTLPIYLDNHATTACDPRVVDAMVPYFSEIYGNAASRTHVYGFQAKAATEIAREQLAAAIGASPKEIVFTSGATEANNLAILGIADAWQAKGRHLVTTAIEHKAVLDPIDALVKRGWTATIVAPGRDGIVPVEAIAAALREDTVLVSVMTANNEIGTLQPIAEIGALCRSKGIPFHTDAAQALGKVPLAVEALNVDLLSLSAHKFHGPKGTGALYVRRGRPRIAINPVFFGGGHERGLRSGTLAVPLLVGMGKAAELAAADVGAPEVRRLRDRLLAGLQAIGGLHVHGSLEKRLPNNLNVGFDGVDGEAVMMAIKEVAVSSGSACTSATLEPSHVLRALGVPAELAHASIRFGLSRFTTEAEIDRAVALYQERVPQLRAMSALSSEGEPPVRRVVWSPET